MNIVDYPATSQEAGLEPSMHEFPSPMHSVLICINVALAFGCTKDLIVVIVSQMPRPLCWKSSDRL
jgi:hypothetical protein